MKKIVIFAVALLLIANLAAFAQVKVGGSLRYDGRYAYDTVEEDGSVTQSLVNEGTGLNASYAGDNISASISFATGGPVSWGYMTGADVTWHPISILSLSAGYGRTPVTYWSGINYQGDSNWGWGAMDITGGRDAYFKVGVSGFLLGIMGNGGAYTDLPVFFAGYDISPSDGISIGVGAAISYRSYRDITKQYSTSDIDYLNPDGSAHLKDTASPTTNYGNAGKEFDAAASLHGTLAFGAASLGFNIGYATGFNNFESQIQKYIVAERARKKANGYTAPDGTAADDNRNLNNEGYLEGFVDFEYKINDTLGAGLSVGAMHDFDYDTTSLRIVAQFPITTSMGVWVAPGADYTLLLGEYDTSGIFGIGASIGYSF